MTEKERGIGFLQKERAQICVSFSVPSLVWAYEEMLVILFLVLIPLNTTLIVLVR